MTYARPSAGSPARRPDDFLNGRAHKLVGVFDRAGAERQRRVDQRQYLLGEQFRLDRSCHRNRAWSASCSTTRPRERSRSGRRCRGGRGRPPSFSRCRPGSFADCRAEVPSLVASSNARNITERRDRRVAPRRHIHVGEVVVGDELMAAAGELVAEGAIGDQVTAPISGLKKAAR